MDHTWLSKPTVYKCFCFAATKKRKRTISIDVVQFSARVSVVFVLFCFNSLQYKPIGQTQCKGKSARRDGYLVCSDTFTGIVFLNEFFIFIQGNDCLKACAFFVMTGLGEGLERKNVGVLPYKDLEFVLKECDIPVKAEKSAEIAMHPIRLILVLFPPSLTVNAFHSTCLSSIRFIHKQGNLKQNS